MLVSIIWQLLCCLCVTISVSFLIGSFVLWATIHGNVNIWEVLTEVYTEFMDTFGLSGVFAGIRYILSLFFQLIMQLIMFFMAITIGQLWAKHKILGSVIFYFVIRFILGILTFIVNLFTGSLNILFADANPARYFSHTTMVSLIVSLVVSVGMYIACIMITDRKLNLD